MLDSEKLTTDEPRLPNESTQSFSDPLSDPSTSRDHLRPLAEDTSEKTATGRFDKTFETENKPQHALVDISEIQLTAADLYDKDKVDLENVELGDVWQLLQ